MKISTNFRQWPGFSRRDWVTRGKRSWLNAVKKVECVSMKSSTSQHHQGTSLTL